MGLPAAGRAIISEKLVGNILQRLHHLALSKDGNIIRRRRVSSDSLRSDLLHEIRLALPLPEIDPTVLGHASHLSRGVAVPVCFL